MVNKFQGEVLIEDGDEKYVFVLGMLAQDWLEEAAGEPWPAFWSRANDWTSKDAVNLFSAGLARHHKTMGKVEVTDLMDRLGPTKCGEIVNLAMTRIYPQQPQSPDKADKQEETEGATTKGSARPSKAPALATC